MTELIIKKKSGLELNEKEISTIIDGFVSGEIPDYQMAAFLMAVYFQKMNEKETALLTKAIMNSGECIDLSEIEGIKVDKHSTGGVGDKTSLVLIPLVAAAGIPIAKMSGRGLGHTGGTLDKLEAIKGFSSEISKEEFIEKVKKNGLAICGQSDQLVPADKKIYALRDVTATVDNFSLISSSIMSKKLACGADAIVIDIKVGSGSFMKNEKMAEELAQMIIGIGADMNKKTVVVLSGMNEPLGLAVGNALEVKEAIETLKGSGPSDFLELCLELGSQMLLLGKVSETKDEALKKLKNLIASGAAFEKFKALISAQGGDLSVIENPDLLPGARFSKEIKSSKEGFVSELEAMNVGLASMKLGAGRATKNDKIDFGAGILLKKKTGDLVKTGETLAILYSNKETGFAEAQKLINSAYKISDRAPEKKPLILKIIE